MQVTFKGSPVQTNGDLPKVGSKAKSFTLVNQDLEDKHLEDFSGKKLLIVVPSLDTSVCLKEAKELNNLAAKHPDISFIVVSADLPFAQKRACVSENIKNIHTLSMMRSKDFAKDYGVLMTDGPLAGLAARSVFLLDASNTITYLQLVSEITKEPDYEEIARRIVM